MIIDIIIDNRETKIYKELKDRDLDKYKDNINIQKKQLDLGDIHIKFNDFIYIYERKTVKDLLSSIKDGRYKEQKTRLLSLNKSEFNINYIIENDSITSNKDFTNQKVLTSVYINSIYRDKINVFFTANVSDTVSFLLLLVSKMIDKPENFINNKDDDKDNNNDDKDTNYIDVCKIKAKKNANIDKDTCYLLQLSQIPSISKEIAKKIKDVYPSLTVLIKSLDDLKDDKNKQMGLLTKINGIGNKKALIIMNYLL